MLKILHTGDIHLDSAFSALPDALAAVRRNELRAAFTSMMTYARMTSVDLILVAGDLFDGAMITRETVGLLIREFENFAKPIFIAPGNHDPASRDSIWHKKIFPPNVHVFTDEALSSVDLPEKNVTVYGYAFTSSSHPAIPLLNQKVADPSRINLLVGHCDMVGLREEDCAITPTHLDAFGADYAALGHIHNPPAPGHDGRWCYCGCLEGRGFDELGPKGACMVEITKNGTDDPIAIKRVRFSKRRYEKGTLPLSGESTHAEIRDAIAAYLSENKFGSDTILALRLTGTVEPSLVIQTETLEESLSSLCSVQITDDTTPVLDTDALEGDITLRGEVYRRLKPALTAEDPRTREIGQRALRYAFNALSGENPLG